MARDGDTQPSSASAGPSNYKVACGTRASRSRVMSTQFSICFSQPPLRRRWRPRAERPNRGRPNLRASSAPTAPPARAPTHHVPARRRREVAAALRPAAAAPHHGSQFRTHQPARRPDHPGHPRFIPLLLPLARWQRALPAPGPGWWHTYCHEKRSLLVHSPASNKYTPSTYSYSFSARDQPAWSPIDAPTDWTGIPDTRPTGGAPVPSKSTIGSPLPGHASC